MDDNLTLIINGATARDHGKRFRVSEVDPLTFSGFVLRLVAALRVESYDTLLHELKGALAMGDAGAPPIDLIMRVLAGCNPEAVHALLVEALENVEVAADPKYPEAFRPVQKTDIRDMATLGAVISAFVKINFAG